MKVLTTVIGALSAIGTTFAWLPQVLKTWRTRSAKDFSWSYLALFSAGVTGWTVYGVLKKDFVIIAANVTTLALTTVIVWVKTRERRQPSG